MKMSISYQAWLQQHQQQHQQQQQQNQQQQLQQQQHLQQQRLTNKFSSITGDTYQTNS